MLTMVLAFCLLFLVMTGMAIGVLVKGKPLKGSCGGIGALGMGRACDICGGNPQKCDKEADEDDDAAKSDGYYELKG